MRGFALFQAEGSHRRVYLAQRCSGRVAVRIRLGFPHPPVRLLVRGFPAPLRHDPPNGLGLGGRDPAPHVHQPPRAQALAVAALAVGGA